jgi:hypothetical protein
VQLDETIRSSLDYQHVYDYCAMNAYHQPGKILLLADNSLHLMQLSRRLADREPLTLMNVDTTPCVNTVIWVEPDLSTAAETLREINQRLVSGGTMYIVVTNWLARYRQKNVNGFSTPWGKLPIAHLLDRIEAVQGFHGLVSILWGLANVFFKRIGRYEIADRCLYQMRATFAVNNWQVRFTPVCVIVVKVE